MRKSGTIVNAFAIAAGIFLLIEGIWGMFSDTVFSSFTTNVLHACIHIILGIVALVLGLMKKSRAFVIFLGLLLIVVAVFRYIPGTDEIIMTLFNVNLPVAHLNMIIGTLALLAAFLDRGKATVTPQP